MEKSSAHPLEGTDGQCYFTLGAQKASQTKYKSVQAVFHGRFLQGTAECSEVSEDFCRYGIDKPLKDGPMITPKARPSAIRRKLDDPRLSQSSTDPLLNTPDSKGRTVTRLEQQLRNFFVPKNSYHKIESIDTLTNKRHQWVSEPLGPNRLRWESLMVIVSILNMILIPVMIAFLDYYDWWSQCLAFNIVFDTLFALDIAYNFRTGYIERQGMDNIAVLEPARIQRHYLQSWFAIDLISTVPLDYILPHLIEFFIDTDFVLGARLLNLGKFLGLLRLLRVCRLVRYMNKLQNKAFFIQWASLRTLNMALLMLMTAHWNGCLHFLVNMCLDFPDRGWISLTGIKNAHWTVQYSWCLFNSISQMLCIGYGRLAPETLVDMWFTLWGMLSGSIGFCLIIAHIAAVWQQMDAPKKLHRQKMMELEEYMNYKDLDGDLQGKIREYFDMRYNGKMFDEESIMASMSEPLRRRIMRKTCEPMIISLPFFGLVDDRFLEEITTRLKTETYQKDDKVVFRGTMGDKVYFVLRGELEVRHHNARDTFKIGENAYFGETSLLYECERKCDVVALTYCRCLTLSRSDFQEVLLRFPDIKKKVQDVIREMNRDRGSGHRDSRFKTSVASPGFTCAAGALYSPSSVIRIPECSDASSGS